MNLSDSAFLQTCLAAIDAQDTPVKAGQLRDLLPKEHRFPKSRLREVEAMLATAAVHGQVHSWPPVRGARRYWRESYHDALDHEVLEYLKKQPAPTGKAGAAVADAMAGRFGTQKNTTSRDVPKRLKEMAHNQRIVEVAANRTTRIYFSREWLANQALATSPNASLEEAIVEAIRQQESAPGNYVPVRRIRFSEQVKRVVDQAALRLVRAGRLMPTNYDGPRPVADEERPRFVHDERGNIYIGLARLNDGES